MTIDVVWDACAGGGMARCVEARRDRLRRGPPRRRRGSVRARGETGRAVITCLACADASAVPEIALVVGKRSDHLPRLLPRRRGPMDSCRDPRSITCRWMWHPVGGDPYVGRGRPGVHDIHHRRRAEPPTRHRISSLHQRAEGGRPDVATPVGRLRRSRFRTARQRSPPSPGVADGGHARCARWSSRSRMADRRTRLPHESKTAPTVPVPRGGPSLLG